MAEAKCIWHDCCDLSCQHVAPQIPRLSRISKEFFFPEYDIGEKYFFRMETYFTENQPIRHVIVTNAD